MKKRILIFSADTKIGSECFESIVEATKTNPPVLKAEIGGIVSATANGCIQKRAERLKIPFIHFPGPYTAESYKQIFEDSQADYAISTGWTKKIIGIEDNLAINTTLGPLPDCAGQYGKKMQRNIITMWRQKKIKQSAISIHFINKDYNKGAGIIQIPVSIRPDDTEDTLLIRAAKTSHYYQIAVMNEIIKGRIYLVNEHHTFIHNKELGRFAFHG